MDERKDGREVRDGQGEEWEGGKGWTRGRRGGRQGMDEGKEGREVRDGRGEEGEGGR